MKKILYLGLEVPPHLERDQKTSNEVTHCPLIQILPRAFTDPSIKSAFAAFNSFTHLIFTSKSAVSIFFDFARAFGIGHEEISLKTTIAIGQRTASKLEENRIQASLIATEETAEGLVKVLDPDALKTSHIFFPHSSLSRPVIGNWLKKHAIPHTACAIYDTVPNIPALLPDLTSFDEIVFTSPSTVDAFLKAYGSFPTGKTLSCIGPITERHLQYRVNA